MTTGSQNKVMAEVVFPVQKPAHKANYTRVLVPELYQKATTVAPFGAKKLDLSTDVVSPSSLLELDSPNCLRRGGELADTTSFNTIFQALDQESQHLVSELMYRLLATKPDQNSPTRPEASALSFLLNGWTDYLANTNKSQHTCYVYHQIVSRLLAQFPTPSAIDIDTYFTILRARVSPRTRQMHVSAIRGFLNFCQQRGCQVEHLIDCLPKVKAIAKRREAAPIESVAAVLSLKDLKPRSKALLYILISSGPRISEVLNVKRSDVDLKGLSITLLGKGSKERTIPITRPTVLAIKEHLATAPKSFYLFPGRRALTWPARGVQDHLKVLCRQAKVDPFTPHQLRHLAATQLILTGANPKSVSEILGHKDPGITLRVYTHANEEINRREHQAHDPLAQVLSQLRRPRGRPRQQRKGGNAK